MINRIKVVFFAGIICVVLMGRVVCAADYVDRVVAVVNDDVITLSEVDKAGKTYFDRIKEKAPANEQAMALEKARKEVLNGLIDKKLVSQKCQ